MKQNNHTMDKTEKKERLNSLLKQFNSRDRVAFGDVYSLIYKELFYFTHSLYKNTPIDCKDAIQDVFVIIWEDKKRQFDSITKLKSYIYVIIKNNFIKYYKHRKFVDKETLKMIDDDSLIFVLESEIYSAIPSALDLLPKECAKVFKLFLDGWNAEEIADELDKKLSTVYNQRKVAIEILKKKLPNDKFFIL